MLSFVASGIISVSDCGDHFKDPVETEDVDFEAAITWERLRVYIRVFRGIISEPTVRKVTQENPSTRCKVTKQDNCGEEKNQLEQVGSFLFNGVFHAVVD